MSRFRVEDSKIIINSTYSRRKHSVGDVVRYYWRPTSCNCMDIEEHIGKITSYALTDPVIYIIDHRYYVPEKDIVCLAADYYSSGPLDLCMTLKRKFVQDNLEIKKVIFNPPATIVLWTDGTKTVVKAAESDEYSKWAGLALCMAKKQLGDDFHKVFKEWCKEDKEEEFDGHENPFLDALYRSFLRSYHNAPVTEKEEEK